MVTLYYIKGINSTDEPAFSTLANQTAFFDSKKVLELDTFYPPHYTDDIYFSSDDIDFNTQFNYASILYANKLYYYFVDRIEYINENLMKVTIVMDDIQTMMFNISINNCVVSRKSISRWGDNQVINRDYLRENFSQGEYIKSDFSDLGNDRNSGFMVVRTEQLSSDTATSIIKATPNISIPTIRGDDHIETSPLFYYFIPFSRNYGFKYYSLTGTTLLNYDEVIPYINELVKDSSKTYIVYYIPDITLVTQAITSSIDSVLGGINNCVRFDIDIGQLNSFVGTIVPSTGVSYEAGILNFGGQQYNNGTTTSDIHLKLTDSRTRYYFNVTQNTALQQPFSYLNIPQLIDSNYYKFMYGEVNNFSTYPIEKLEYNSVNCHYIFDTLYNNRVYYITSYTISHDYYNTAVNCEGNNLPLIAENAMSTYMSTHVGTMGLMPLQTALSSLDFDSTSYSERSSTTKYSYGRGTYNLGKLSKTATDVTSATTSAITGIDAFSTGLSLANSVINATATIGNVLFTPNSVSQQGNINCAMDIPTPTILVYRVTDIEDVGKLYESLGYLVHETYDGDDIVSNWATADNWNIRYYFNVLQFDDVNITLKNCPSDNETISRIINRFKDGLRLWNTDGSTLRLELGYLWVYDNVERKYVE